MKYVPQIINYSGFRRLLFEPTYTLKDFVLSAPVINLLRKPIPETQFTVFICLVRQSSRYFYVVQNKKFDFLDAFLFFNLYIGLKNTNWGT